jgi:exopolysaccharide biosynthesis WecB/TagA/CpsF family protein
LGPRQDLLGLVAFDDVDAREAASWLAARPAGAPFAFAVAPNAQCLVLVSQGHAFAQACDEATLMLNDSQVVRGLARLFFGQHIKLCAGSDLTMLLLREVLRPEDPITVIGGPPDVAALLEAQYGLTRVVQHDPPMGYANRPDEFDRAMRFVIDNPARITFVCTGVPRSEALLLAVHRAGGATGFGLAVGSSLHFATGLVKRAPKIMRRLGLEWLWRLALNPRQHARRVFVESMPLLGLVLRAWWRGAAARG